MPPVYRILPAWAPFSAITLFRRIFAKKDTSDLTIQHEIVHVRQQGKWWFYFAYLFWPPARARMECEAYAVQAKAGCNVSELAGFVASWLYLWPCSKAKAEQLIRSYAGME